MWCRPLLAQHHICYMQVLAQASLVLLQPPHSHVRLHPPMAAHCLGQFQAWLALQALRLGLFQAFPAGQAPLPVQVHPLKPSLRCNTQPPAPLEFLAHPLVLLPRCHGFFRESRRCLANLTPRCRIATAGVFQASSAASRVSRSDGAPLRCYPRAPGHQSALHDDAREAGFSSTITVPLLPAVPHASELPGCPR